MVDEKVFKEVEEELLNIGEQDLADLRPIDEAKLILNSLKNISVKLKALEIEEGLFKLFEKKYTKLSSLHNSSYLADICLESDFLFPDSQSYPFVEGAPITEDYMQAIEEDFGLWVDTVKKSHIDTQEKLAGSFSLGLKQSELSCHCQKCVADYRAKIRDQLYADSKELILEFVAQVEEQVLTEDINKISKSYEKLRDNLNKKINKVKNKLRRGSINRLTNDVKYVLKQHLGYQTELGKTYSERLKTFFVSILTEDEYDADLITNEEYERFFTQLGLNIWKPKSYLKREFDKLVRSILAFKRKDISATILRDYLGQFWIHSSARRMKRKIIYHMGPTNSGKTYHAIEALAKSKSGSYLAPLRLLASELFDTLNDKGVPTTLLTGEEVVEIDNAKHYSSTIEMARLNDDFDCVVIDEIQMITDSQRGWAWTRALVNMNAPEIHLCGDQSVLELVQKILKLTGDELHIEHYERKTKLAVEKRPVRLVDLRRNDTLIVFSRKNALKYKRDLESLNFKVSVVYGRLSPEVRREQARKFDEGETDIMVATDAIAMGMNLPVRRIVFSAIAKFFNSQEYPLTASELKQIAGRAGRFQRFPEGYVTTLNKVEDGLEVIEEALHQELEQKEFAMVGPDLDIFRSVNEALEEHNLKTLGLSEFLRLFNTMTFEKPFFCVDLSEMIEVTEMVEGIDRMDSLSDAEKFGFSCAPVNLGLNDHVQHFHTIVTQYVGKQMIMNEEIDTASDHIDYLETSIKCVELYQWLARHFNNNHFSFDEQRLLHNKSMAIEKLNTLLSEKIAKQCPSCGVKLAESFQFNICESCFELRKTQYRKKGSYKSRNSKGPKGDKKKDFKGGGFKKKSKSSRSKNSRRFK